MWLIFKIVKPEAGGNRLEVICALDDTFTEKQGSKFYGVSPHYKAHNNRKEKMIWGNCWVCFGLLFRFGNKWLFFPISALLYVREKYVKIASDFKTKLELGVQIIESLELPDHIHLIVATDGFYGPKKNFARKLLAKGVDIVSRLRIDAAIYELPIEKKLRKRGRPRKYGERLHIRDIAEDDNLFSDVEALIYGKKRIVRAVSKIIMIRGWDKPVRIVITKDVHKNPVVLFSTDITLYPARILEIYSARWKIELSFRELKQFWKMADYRVRNKEGMTRHVTLCFVAHSMLLLQHFTKFQSDVQPVYRPWYKRAGITVDQLRMMHQREHVLHLFFGLMERLGIPYEKDQVINEFNDILDPRTRNRFEQGAIEIK